MNTSRLRITTLALVAALSLVCADFAQAQPAAHFAKDGPRQEAPLSPEQMETVQKMSKAFFDQTLPLRQALIVKKAELKAQMLSPNPDAAKVETLYREIGDLRGKMAVARLNLREELEKQGIPARHCPMSGMGPGPRQHGFDTPGLDRGSFPPVIDKGLQQLLNDNNAGNGIAGHSQNWDCALAA